MFLILTATEYAACVQGACRVGATDVALAALQRQQELGLSAGRGTLHMVLESLADAGDVEGLVQV